MSNSQQADISQEDLSIIQSILGVPSDHNMGFGTQADFEDFGLPELFPENPSDEYASPHVEENILESIGRMKTRAILMDKVVEYSDIQKCLHVKRGSSLKFHVTCEGVPSSDNNFEKYYIRLMLVRNHNGFTHLPVDRVCDVHGTGDELKSHVLRISKDQNSYPANYVDGKRPSIVFEVGSYVILRFS